MGRSAALFAVAGIACSAMMASRCRGLPRVRWQTAHDSLRRGAGAAFSLDANRWHIYCAKRGNLWTLRVYGQLASVASEDW